MQITVNGVKLFFDVDGEKLKPHGASMREKPTVVLVHGGPGADHSVAKPFYSQLTDIAQVVFYDQRGNGRSDLGNKEDWTLDQWASDLKALCDALSITKPIVIGTSFGGFVTIAYATKYPEHAAGLVLISTAASVDFEHVYAAFERLGGRAVRAVAESYWEAPTSDGRAAYKEVCVPHYTYTKGGSDDWLSRVLWRDDTALWFNGPHNEHGQFDYTRDLQNIACPVLVLAGEQDPITPPAFSDAIARGLRTDLVSYVKYEECGHGVVKDKPEEALKSIRDFVLGI